MTPAPPSPVAAPSSASLPRGTKIVATLGPATNYVPALERLFEAGVNVARLNFSHGTRQSHARTLHNVRTVIDRRPDAVAILGDLCGPKIRLGNMVEGGAEIAAGDHIDIAREECVGDARRVCINQPEILDDLEAGQRVLIDDGTIRLHVERKTPEGVQCICDVGGVLRDHKGVNLPDSNLQLSPLTGKDLDDLTWAVKNDLDYIALSFVRRAEDVEHLRDLLRERSSDLPIVSKIETPQAVANLDGIIAASDAVLVARGDLGVEMDVAHVPRVQKSIVDKCRSAGKPVIVATQMLQSMIEAPIPTRAEVSDVANAILDGADAVMLSGETAVGKYPVAAVEMLHRIAIDTEGYDQERAQPVGVNVGRPGVSAAVANSMALVCQELTSPAAAVWTEAGVLARLLSKHRLDLPVLAFTPAERARRRMALYYGIHPRTTERIDALSARIARMDDHLLSASWAKPGDLVVMGFGPRSLDDGDTGAVTIHRVGSGH